MPRNISHFLAEKILVHKHSKFIKCIVFLLTQKVTFNFGKNLNFYSRQQTELILNFYKGEDLLIYRCLEIGIINTNHGKAYKTSYA